jgi:hypothetical protein
VEFCKRFDWVEFVCEVLLLLLLPVRIVIDDDSRLNEPLKLGSDVERCRPFTNDDDKSS